MEMNKKEKELVDYLKYKASALISGELEVDYVESGGRLAPGFYICDYDGVRSIPKKMLITKYDVERHDINMSRVCSEAGCFYCF